MKRLLVLFAAVVACLCVQTVFAQGPSEGMSIATDRPPVKPMPELPADGNQVIMVFDGKELTINQLRYMQPGLDSQTIQKLAEYWIEMQFLAEEAVKEGLENNAKVQFLADAGKKKALATALIEKKLSEINITEEQIRKYYDEAKNIDSTLSEPMFLSYSHITVESQEKADAVMKKIKDGNDFNGLAKTMSIARDASQGGKVAKATVEMVERRVGVEAKKALLDANQGAIIGPITGRENMLEIIKLESKIPAKVMEYDQVKESIKNKILSETKKSTFENLLKQLKEDGKSRCVRKGILADTEPASENTEKPAQVEEKKADTAKKSAVNDKKPVKKDKKAADSKKKTKSADKK